MSDGETRRIAAGGLGVLALVFWASTVAVSRTLTEALGTFTAAALIFLLSGTIASIPVLLSPRRRRSLARLPRAYWIGCGSLFVAYMVGLYVAIGFARGRQQTIEVGMINYLWPSLTLVFAIPILGKRGRWTLLPGMAMACAGVVAATFNQAELTWTSFAANVRANTIPYLAALAAAVSWALYSNASRRWAGHCEGNGVPVFLLAAGIVLAGLRALIPEAPPEWTPRAGAELAYTALFPTLLAYTFWDRAMRRGPIILLASLSYGTPVLSAILSGLHLGVRLGLPIWAGCALVAGGAAVCSASVVDRAGPRRP